ncbi:MAG: secretin and TonB N-terminal domain-containing protein [Pseudomonadota bacterium]|nr:secretin and TonB N-terminal domain-containing protein [Pseudomonadota bacterium]
MKEYKLLAGFALLCLLWALTTAGSAGGQGTEGGAPGVETGYLEEIRFERLPGKERVSIIATRRTGVEIEDVAGRDVVVHMEDTHVPTDLRKFWGEKHLHNVIHAVPEQGWRKGRPAARIVIALREAVPHGVRQEGNAVIIDFNVAALPAAAQGPTSPAAAPSSGGGGEAATAASGSATVDIPKMSVDFQEADIRGVFRLLAEQGKVNLVVSPEVKGNVTVRMDDVSWEQILATILEINGLRQKRSGNVISVMTAEREKKDEEDRIATIQKRQKLEEEAKKAAISKNLEMGRLKQLMIEAKILEVTEGFIRNLGVQWGAGVQLGLSGNDYSMGLLGGTASLATPITKLNSGVSLTRDALAMSLGTTLAPTLGIILGGSNAVLEARIHAMETNSSGRVLSAPRVLTQDSQKAVIEQGEEIPIVTPASANNPASTTYKPATLKLEVTPEIKDDNHILMTIKAKNDRPNKAEKDAATGNMPVYTSSVDSKVVVMDGDTIVIGGILKTEDTKNVGGVPWLSQIPFLGWLFKYEYVEKTKRELLIFLTPRIVKPSEASFTRM